MDTARPMLATTRAELGIQIRRHLEERTQIEDEARRRCLAIDGQLLVLRRKLNGIAPIACLPAEILGTVFEYYLLLHWDQYDRPCLYWELQVQVFPYSWFTILHVCHDWRQVALSNPALWTHVVPTTEECLEFVLSKSGNLPLVVSAHNFEETEIDDPTFLNNRAAEQSRMYHHLMKRLPRIRTAQFLLIKDAHTAFSASELNRLQVDADMLEDLYVDAELYPAASDFPMLSSSAMPHLNSLNVFRGSTGLLNSLLRSSLTMLRAVEIGSPFSVDELALTLSHLPYLRTMSLSLPHTFFRSLPTVLPPPLHTASLPNLKHLDLKGQPLIIAQLLNCFIFPSNTIIRLQSYPGSSAEETRLAIPSILSKIVGSTVANPMCPPCPRLRPRSLMIDEAVLRVSLWSTTLESWSNSDNAKSIPDLHMIVPCQIVHEVDAIANFTAALDLSEVVTMSIRPIVHAHDWERIFENLTLPKLETLHLSSQFGTEFFSNAMVMCLTQTQPTLGEDGMTASSHYLFPDLKTLELDGVVLHERPHEPSDDDYFFTVTNLLLQRGVCVRKLDKLVLVNPINLHPSDYDALNTGRYAKCYEVHNPTTDDSDTSDTEGENDESGDLHEDTDEEGENSDLQ